VTLRVAILGPGRAGRSLANAFAAAGIEVSLVGRGQRVPLVDVVLVTVRDDDLRAALDCLTTLPAGTVVLHASGVTDARGAGTFHPLVSLNNPDAGASTLRGAWIGVDGDARAITIAKQLAAAISANVLEIPPGAKGAYHAAAVIAANFPAVLAAAAERELRRVGVEPGPAHGAVVQLMRSALEGVDALGPQKALTGPVSRGDAGTVNRNLQAMADDPAVRDLYVAATRIAIELARAAGTNPERLAEIERLLLHP
jgi:predicted short-subunit dehydrogenase-like oxidoreductase (DUF2520 family)